MDTLTRPPTADLYRSTPPLEVRASDDGRMTLFGHFSVFNSPTEINSAYEGRFVERIAPGAFTKTLAERGDQIRIMWNHGKQGELEGAIIARADTITEDKRGGYYEASLFRGLPEWLYEGLREGQYGASFRFAAVRDDWNDTPDRSDSNPEALPERTVTEAKLYELGPVSFGAYDDATAAVRSLSDRYHDLSTSPDRAAPGHPVNGDAATATAITPPLRAPVGLTPAQRESALRSIQL